MYHLHKDEMVCNAVQAISPGPVDLWKANANKGPNTGPYGAPFCRHFNDDSVALTKKTEDMNETNKEHCPLRQKDLPI